MINTINKLLQQLPKLGRLFYMDKAKESYNKLAEITGDINNAMVAFIGDIPIFNEQGAGIPLDVVIAQLNNLVCALQAKDTLMIADCLCYEISESLSLYKEILGENTHDDIAEEKA